MRPRVRLLSLPSPDWAAYVSFVSEVAGTSPTRECDSRGDSVGDSHSFLRSLEDVLKTKKFGYQYSVTFLIHLDVELLTKYIVQWSNPVRIQFLWTNKKETESLVFATTSLEDWKQIITQGSQQDEFRYLMNQKYVLLDKHKLTYIFKGSNREMLDDQTFKILEG